MGCSSSTAVLAVDEDASPATQWRVQLEKRQGDVLGAGLGNAENGAVIFNIKEDGLVDLWNRSQQLRPLRPGYIITEVNGVTGYWDIIEELRKPGVLDLRVTAEPPAFAGPNWFQEITEMGKRLEGKGARNSFLIRLQSQEPGAQNGFSSLPNVRAGDCGVDQCAICMSDVTPEESLVQLPCGHAFHALCAARWLTQAGSHSQGKRQCCPLCCQRVVGSPEGGITFSRPAN